MNGSRTAGQRAGLTRAAVLRAARRIVEARGLEALTMRSLAEELGVQPNALYSHVQNKAALVERLSDDVLGEVRTPAADGDWREGLHEVMQSTYEVLIANPEFVSVYLGRGSRGENARALGDVMLQLLDRGGVTGAEAREALRVLVVYTIGFAAYAVQPGFGDEDEPARTAELAGNFRAGLSWLLTGIASSARRSIS